MRPRQCRRRETCAGSGLSLSSSRSSSRCSGFWSGAARRPRWRSGRGSRRFRPLRSSSRNRAPRSQHLVLPGTVQAWYEAPIYARVPGYLKNWYFDYGAHVKKGDVLAEIETPDLDAQLAAAQAKLNSARALVNVREAEKQFAESTYQRWRESPKGVVSVQEQESKQADYNSAVARLNSATAEVAADQGEVDRLQALESFKSITAPFDGVVTARETDIGALINAGSGTGGGNGPELFRVADLHKMRIYVQVPQQLSADIQNRPHRRTALAAISGQDLQGDRRDHLERHQYQRPHPAGGTPRRQSGRPVTAGRLRPGRFRTAEQSQCRAHSDQRADVPRARNGSRHHRSATTRSSSSRLRSDAISAPRSRLSKG